MARGLMGVANTYDNMIQGAVKDGVAIEQAQETARKQDKANEGQESVGLATTGAMMGFMAGGPVGALVGGGLGYILGEAL